MDAIPVLRDGFFYWLNAPLYNGRSGPPDHTQDERDQRKNDKDMDHSAYAIYENAKEPSDQ
jgi:hypothetical protein